jgi:radical SAM superfamily enzyme YgiQ (UPF0313 family)
MRISLVNPNLSGDVSILDIGLTYLATYINARTQHRASIIDFTFHAKEWQRHLERQLDKHQPDVVGITCTSLYLHYVQAIAGKIKQWRDISIICGGYHASLDPEDTMGVPGVDAVCIGDGEFTLSEYLDALEEKRRPDNIPGLWFRRNGGIVKNPLRDLIRDIDSLPLPDYDLWEDIDDYLYFNQLLYFMGTRGCPYNCTYCSEYPMRQAVPGRHYRERNPRAFAREIKQQWDKYKYRNMKLAHAFDPVFSYDKEWLKDFCDEYRKIGMPQQLPFSCFSRADLLDEEKIRILAQAGCKIVRIGVEAGNYHIRRDIYQKDITNEKFIEVVQLCKKYGLGITSYYILGGPGENLSTLRDTFNLARCLDANRPVFFIYQPLPHTQAREKLLELGGTIEEERMRHIDSLHHASAIRTRELKPIQIEIFQYKCLIYFMGKRILRLFKKQKLRLLGNFFRYFIRARRKGVPLWYAIAYFLICCDDNLIS